MKYIIANWKMNMDLAFLSDWLGNFGEIIKNKEIDNEVILAGSSLYLDRVSQFTKDYRMLHAGAQDISSKEKGAHTGEVGAFQIKDYAKYCIVGHSERAEKRELVKNKALLCLKNHVTPIVCFTNPKEVLENQIEGAILAWEDPDNISKGGTYREKDFSEIESAFEFMKKTAPETCILYGGSVNKSNVEKLASLETVSGVLVGSASLDPDHFFMLVNAFQKN